MNNAFSSTEIAVLERTLEIARSLKEKMTAKSQIDSLRNAIACTDASIPIRDLESKKMQDHFREMVGLGFYSAKAAVSYFGFADLMTVRITKDIKKGVIGFRSEYPGGRMIFRAHLMFLAWDRSIITMDSTSWINGEEIAPAHHVEVLTTDDKFLETIMTSKDKGTGNKQLVSRFVLGLSAAYKKRTAELERQFVQHSSVTHQLERLGKGLSTVQLE